MTTSTKDELISSAPQGVMDKFVKNILTHPQVGDLIEGMVLGQDRMALYVDLSPIGTGIIYGREYLNARDIIKKINAGDVITAKVVEAETEDGGYVGLSLKEARQAIVWAEAENAIKNKTILEILVKDANKGGLILEWQNIVGFLPASQLKAEHYPRINDGDKDKIVNELRKLIGTKISVSVITANPKEGKLIFSEKTGAQKERVEMVNKYNIGDILDGEVTGAVDFGVFVKLEDSLEGLVHISEIDWALVDNPKKLFKQGDKIKVKIIDIKDGKVSLSIKALKESPWKAAELKYKKGARVNGVVIKYNKHGALVSIEEGVAGLAHISLFGTEENMKKRLELGKSYDFVITLFDAKEQKMTLIPADLYKEVPDTKTEEKKEEA
ncbi:MAG: S1 RNA-binding domain-containing protein [Candidatus Vogelbacteria bacterium]|nr:S1 RNA-binding domain-containing protein [Candidatus Vogelbacteria bacterium]